MGVQVGRDVVLGAEVLVGFEVVVLVGFEVVVLVGFEVVVLVGFGVRDVLLDDELLDVEDVGDDVGSVVSCRGRSCTGGGSAGAAATRKPSSTSSGTQSIAARSMPSRPSRRRGAGVMSTRLRRGHESRMRVG